MPPLILVVEDDANALQAICRTLALEGYRYLPTKDADQALGLLGSGHMPDLLLIDVRLLGISGSELALQIHERHPGVPVLFVSGWPAGLMDADTLTPFRWEFLAKPFAPDTLVNRIHNLLKQSEVSLGDARE